MSDGMKLYGNTIQGGSTSIGLCGEPDDPVPTWHDWIVLGFIILLIEAVFALAVFDQSVEWCVAVLESSQHGE